MGGLQAEADIQRLRRSGFSRELFIKANKELGAKAPPTDCANDRFRHLAVRTDKTTANLLLQN